MSLSKDLITIILWGAVLIHSHVRLLVTPWTVAHQAPPSMGFPRQEYWSGLPVPSRGDLPNPGIKPICLASPELAGSFFTTEPPGKLTLHYSLKFLILPPCKRGILRSSEKQIIIRRIKAIPWPIKSDQSWKKYRESSGSFLFQGMQRSAGSAWSICFLVMYSAPLRSGYGYSFSICYMSSLFPYFLEIIPLIKLGI